MSNSFQIIIYADSKEEGFKYTSLSDTTSDGVDFRSRAINCGTLGEVIQWDQLIRRLLYHTQRVWPKTLNGLLY